jgi:DNA-directed RNA polymerase specialized sigma24 family protein
MSFQYSGGTEQPGPANSERSTVEPRDPTRRAFIDLHGRSLNGFALLLCLGDEEIAAQLSADALAQGSERVAALGHPERAAAWLRSEVYRAWVPVYREAAPPLPDSLAALGVVQPALDGLHALDGKERAALIAGDIERLDRRDAATVVGSSERQFSRIIERARRDYLDAFAKAAGREAVPEGPLVRHIHLEAARLLA